MRMISDFCVFTDYDSNIREFTLQIFKKINYIK